MAWVIQPVLWASPHTILTNSVTSPKHLPQQRCSRPSYHLASCLMHRFGVNLCNPTAPRPQEGAAHVPHHTYEPISSTWRYSQSENERVLCHRALQCNTVTPWEAMHSPLCCLPSAHTDPFPPYSHQLSRAATSSKSICTFLHALALDHKGTNMLPQLRGFMFSTLHTHWYRSFTPSKTQLPLQYNLQHLFS